MPKRFPAIVWAGAIIGAFAVAPSSFAADNYKIDTAHSCVTFKISHLGLAWIHGRFNEFSGSFVIDAENAANSTFELSINASSIDTNNKQRDDHLRSPDFFNVKQFPSITFKSTAVKANEKGYQVTGDLTMHGATKSVTFDLVGGKTAEFPRGTKRTGFTADLVIKRSDFKVGMAGPALGDDVHASISFEGTSR
jgi:polyisoprenoid-binding protein YceI